MAIIGAILGDIAGSRFEYDRPEDLDWKNCELFTDDCAFTDDTVMSLAVKYAVDNHIDFTVTLQEIGRCFPYCGYGRNFIKWLFSENPQPYHSFGNGSAMRVSYIGEYFDDVDDVRKYAEMSAEISHNHPEGIKGAVTTAVCVWMAKHGKTKQEIYDYLLSQYPADTYGFIVNKDMDYLREHYSWDIRCTTSVPVALRCFYESDSYESFLRNVFSLDCDTDTICAIGGGIAEEFYKTTGLPEEQLLKKYLDDGLLKILYA
ncbi:MAG: ADP-ribosylglycohydrolase family protein [Eubacteriales bacterium]|nr:ADP-ribosylglycohydrolase family protein [Eubacteriales bacterium]